MILNTQGLPEPSREILEGYRRISPRLGMRFFPVGDNGRGQFAITEDWKENDPRRQMIQRGEMAPGSDFDVIGFAPIDMRSEDAADHLVRCLQKAPKTPDELAALLSRVSNYNKEQQKRNLQPVKDFSAELFEANRSTVGTRTTVGRHFSTAQTRKLSKEERDAKVELVG